MADHRLLAEFSKLFSGKKYEHRIPNLGDFVAMHLYEDLVSVRKSDKYVISVCEMSHVLNVQNRRKGIEARRGDGTFGELIVGITPQVDPGFKVARGPVANVEIGVEVKILAKAMIKQIDRVKNDLSSQVRNFRNRSGSFKPICVGIVGLNYAAVTTSYEGDRSYRTDGKSNKHPIQEAEQARARLETVRPEFDEFLILRYRATNEEPFPFEWVNQRETELEYGAALIRISNEYQRRF